MLILRNATIPVWNRLRRKKQTWREWYSENMPRRILWPLILRLMEWTESQGSEMLAHRREANSGQRQWRKCRKYLTWISKHQWLLLWLLNLRVRLNLKWTMCWGKSKQNIFLLSVCLNHMHKSPRLEIEDGARLILLFSNLRKHCGRFYIDSFHGWFLSESIEVKLNAVTLCSHIQWM